METGFPGPTIVEVIAGIASILGHLLKAAVYGLPAPDSKAQNNICPQEPRVGLPWKQTPHMVGMPTLKKIETKQNINKNLITSKPGWVDPSVKEREGSGLSEKNAWPLSLCQPELGDLV